MSVSIAVRTAAAVLLTSSAIASFAQTSDPVTAGAVSIKPNISPFTGAGGNNQFTLFTIPTTTANPTSQPPSTYLTLPVSGGTFTTATSSSPSKETLTLGSGGIEFSVQGGAFTVEFTQLQFNSTAAYPNTPAITGIITVNGTPTPEGRSDLFYYSGRVNLQVSTSQNLYHILSNTLGLTLSNRARTYLTDGLHQSIPDGVSFGTVVASSTAVKQ